MFYLSSNACSVDTRRVRGDLRLIFFNNKTSLTSDRLIVVFCASIEES